MTFEKLLSQHKATVLKQWFNLVLETYPPETANLFKKEKNEFANPVGHTVRVVLDGLYDKLVQGGDIERENVSALLDRIVRIRAIQDFSPSQAVAFMFLLKKIIRRELKGVIEENSITTDEMVAFESKIDEVGLLAFNVYMACREKLYEVRLDEIKNRTQRLLQRANLLAEIPEFVRGDRKPKTPNLVR